MKSIALSHDTQLNLPDGSNTIFKAGTVAILNDNGKVIKGTLSHDTQLNLPDGSNMIFTAGTMITFNENGKVISSEKGEFTFVLSGIQIAGNIGHNAELQSRNLKLDKRCIITYVEGNNDGFWIVGEWGNMIKEYYVSNDKSAIGYILEPGTYRTYPRLKLNAKEGSVSITLESK